MDRERRKRPRPSPELMAALHAGKAALHRERAQMPLREKVRAVLELQRLCMPLIARHRQPEEWEHPWTVTP